MKVMFCGHSDVDNKEAVRKWLLDVCTALSEDDNVTFYSGGYGSFDAIAKDVVYSLKKTKASIRNVLILAYLDRKPDISKFDESIYPPIENVPKRYAILKRNKW
ncbi:MAG: hypothetical protein HFE63_05945, partial [Clostridiales bacterium]|nr:hypothetical protein [Clostridiales bacterium]